MRNHSTYFVQHILWRGLFFLSGFMVNILIARHFGPEGSGINYYTMAMFSFATLVLSGSYESAIVYFSSNIEISSHKLFGLSLLWILIGFMLLGLVGCFTALSQSENRNGYLWLHGSMFIVGNLMVGFMSSFYSAEKDFKTPGLVGVVINVLLMMAIACIHTSNWISAPQFWALYFGSFLIQGIIMLWVLLGQGMRGAEWSLPNSAEIKKIIHYLVVVFVCNVAMFACYRLDYWFVHQYCSLSALGNYIQVSKLVQLFFILPGVLAGVVFPLTASDNKTQTKEMIALLSRLLFTLYLAGCLVLAATGKWLFPWVFGEEFTQMYNSFLFYIPGVLFFSALFSLTAYFAGSGRVIVNLKGALIALVVIVTGDFLAIPVWGINGAAMISSLGYMSYFFYVISVYSKEHQVGIGNFLIMNKKDIGFIGQILKKETDTLRDSK